MIKRIFGLGCIVVFGILFSLFIFSNVASATDWTYTNPMGLGYTNRIGDQFVIVNNNATDGRADSINLQSGGSYTMDSYFTNCRNCTYAMVNPIDNTRWVTDEGGNVSYTTQITPVDYSAGFFTAGVAGTCWSLGGNCNNLHRVGTFTATVYPIKMAFDSDGNVYAVDGLIIKKFIRSRDYSSQTFYTLVSGVDFVDVGGGALTNLTTGLQVDANNNLYVLLGSHGVGFGVEKISFIKITSSGVREKTELIYNQSGGGLVNPGVLLGGLVLDVVNPTQNYTYAYTTGLADSAFIKHNSSSGTIDVGGGALVGITDLADIGYYNYQIYLTSPSQNLIRSYVTNFQGYGFASGASTNPDGITGTFIWTDQYGNSVGTKPAGEGLTWRYTLDTSNPALLNYTYWVGWGYDAVTFPNSLQNMQNINAVSSGTGMFQTSTFELQNNGIYGYLLARDRNGSYSRIANLASLFIQGQGVGTDSITLNKYVFNNSGTEQYLATFTYSDTALHTYVYQFCRSADCRDQEYGGFLTAVRLLLNYPSTDTGVINLPVGRYYAVLMQKFGKDPITSIIGGLLGYTVVDKKPFDVVSPNIAVNWDRSTYNLMPKSITSNPCHDSTSLTSYFTTIDNWAGLQKGFLSCQQTPGYAEANNSLMKASLYSKYNGTFYLNNSWGNIWNGTLSNGSGQLIYVLTNSSPTGQWTLFGTDGTNVSSSTAIVRPESELIYTLSQVPCGQTVSSACYNGDTIFFTWTTPIYKVFGSKVFLYDSGGQLLKSWNTKDAPNGDKFYIDPMKSYSYGTWTATINDVGIATAPAVSISFRVVNGGRPKSNNSLIPVGGNRTVSDVETCGFFDDWVEMMFSKINNITRFGFALIIISTVLIVTGIGMRSLGAGVICAFLPYVFFVFLSLATPCGEYMPVWTAVFIALIIGIKLKWFT